jgi:hypothetical protein
MMAELVRDIFYSKPVFPAMPPDEKFKSTNYECLRVQPGSIDCGYRLLAENDYETNGILAQKKSLVGDLQQKNFPHSRFRFAISCRCQVSSC